MKKRHYKINKCKFFTLHDVPPYSQFLIHIFNLKPYCFLYYDQWFGPYSPLPPPQPELQPKAAWNMRGCSSWAEGSASEYLSCKQLSSTGNQACLQFVFIQAQPLLMTVTGSGSLSEYLRPQDGPEEKKGEVKKYHFCGFKGFAWNIEFMASWGGCLQITGYCYLKACTVYTVKNECEKLIIISVYEVMKPCALLHIINTSH